MHLPVCRLRKRLPTTYPFAKPIHPDWFFPLSRSVHRELRDVRGQRDESRGPDSNPSDTSSRGGSAHFGFAAEYLGQLRHERILDVGRRASMKVWISS